MGVKKLLCLVIALVLICGVDAGSQENPNEETEKGAPQPYIPVSENLFRRLDDPEAIAVLTENPDGKRVLTTQSFYYEKAPKWKTVVYRILVFWRRGHYDVSDCLFFLLDSCVSLQTVKAQENPAHVCKDERGSAVRLIISCFGYGDLHGFRTVYTGNRTKDACQCGFICFNSGFCRIVGIEFIYILQEFF